MADEKRHYRLRWVDVFTDRPLLGNPLAVVLEADGLSDAKMQAIARETNLSETTFVLPPEKREHAAKVRIFTPHVELPFAGHPTVGTGWVLIDEGLVGSDATTSSWKKASVRYRGGSNGPRDQSFSGCRIRHVRLAR